MSLWKKYETIGVTRHRAYAEMMCSAYALAAEVYERPPSIHFPEVGVLYVVSRKKTCKQ